MVRLKASVNSAQRQRRTDQQRGADEQHQGQPDLDHDQRLAHACLPTAASAGHGAFHRDD
jgi:hypothetical protein